MVGDMQRDRGVGRVGTAADDQNSEAAAQLGVGDGHKTGDTLVPTDDQADLRQVTERVSQRQIGFAGNAVDEIDPMRNESGGEQRCGRSGHARILRGPGYGTVTLTGRVPYTSPTGRT